MFYIPFFLRIISSTHIVSVSREQLEIVMTVIYTTRKEAQKELTTEWGNEKEKKKKHRKKNCFNDLNVKLCEKCLSSWIVYSFADYYTLTCSPSHYSKPEFGVSSEKKSFGSANKLRKVNIWIFLWAIITLIVS